MVLILLIPICLLCAALAWMCLKAKHPEVALVMAGTSLLCLVLSVATIYGGIFLYDAVKAPLAGGAPPPVSSSLPG